MAGDGARRGADAAQDALGRALVRLLAPLARILLRNGVTFRSFSEVAKSVFVRVAEEDEFRIPRRKQSDSRIAVITGLTRKDVRRLRGGAAGGGPGMGRNRAARVVEGWVNDAGYRDAAGPRTLPLEGEGSFAELVRRYSGDAPARAVLDELERVGVAQRLGDGQVVLVAPRYEPIRNREEDLRRLGEAAGSVLEALDQELGSDGQVQRIRWVRSSAPLAPAAARAYLEAAGLRGEQLLERAASELAGADRAGSGGVSVGTLVADLRREEGGD